MNRRTISFGLAIVPAFFTISHTSAVLAKNASSWNGTWTGAWGGQASTSITIAGNKVTAYLYQCTAVSVMKSGVAGNKVTFEGPDYTIVVVRSDAKTANVEYKNTRGDVAGAVLTLQ